MLNVKYVHKERKLTINNRGVSIRLFIFNDTVHFENSQEYTVVIVICGCVCLCAIVCVRACQTITSMYVSRRQK